MKKVYTVYSNTEDITFILEDTELYGNVISTEVKGFYFGEPDEKATEQYYGSLKAEF